MIISLGFKRSLETNISKKAIFLPVDKSFWRIFSQLIEHEKRDATTCRGTEGILTSIFQDIIFFLKELGGRWKRTFHKKALFPPGDKRLWLVFSRIFDCDKPQGTFHKCAKGIPTITVEVIISFL